jgi:Protein of unknown function (DUF4236)
MPFRLYRRFRIFPGLSVNASRSGLSASVGGRSAHVTVGPRGTRLSASIPGTGLGWYTNLGHVQATPLPVAHVCQLPECNPAMVPVGRALGFAFFGVVALAALAVALWLALG